MRGRGRASRAFLRAFFPLPTVHRLPAAVAAVQHEPSRLEAIEALLAAGSRQLAEAAALGYSFQAFIAAAAQQTAAAVAEATRVEKAAAAAALAEATRVEKAAAAAAVEAERVQASALQVRPRRGGEER